MIALSSEAPTPAVFRTMPGTLADGRALMQPSRIYVDHATNQDAIAAFARNQFRVSVISPIQHARFFNADYSRGGLAVLHNFGGADDAELLVYGEGAVFSRALVRYLASWAFNVVGLRRVTTRMRSNDTKGRDYARRLGFRPEGVQRRWFADDVDAHLWGMLRSECPWIGLESVGLTRRKT